MEREASEAAGSGVAQIRLDFVVVVVVVVGRGRNPLRPDAIAPGADRFDADPNGHALKPTRVDHDHVHVCG